ncbi:unnamed protein product [Toxocara canis]|uniref:Pentatricopeptide repeat-containing protein n=1 Tax=Toxocara canis TaxID=6265 RepID=A0A183V9Z9_TOXCA|nr:unnamed protein product [Toxocara canis]
MNGIVHSVNVQRKSVKIEEGTSQDHCSVAVSMQLRTPIAVNSNSQPQSASKSVIEHRNISEVASAVSTPDLQKKLTLLGAAVNRLPAPNAVKPKMEQFRRDEASLDDILSQRPIRYSACRPSNLLVGV